MSGTDDIRPIIQKAIVAKWNASASLSGIAGPFLNIKQAQAANQFPYCVFRIPECIDDGWTCKNRRWLCSVVFEIRGETQASAIASLNLVTAVFGVNQLSLTLDAGSLISNRMVSSYSADEDESVKLESVTMRMRMNYPLPS